MPYRACCSAFMPGNIRCPGNTALIVRSTRNTPWRSERPRAPLGLMDGKRDEMQRACSTRKVGDVARPMSGGQAIEGVAEAHLLEKPLLTQKLEAHRGAPQGEVNIFAIRARRAIVVLPRNVPYAYV